MTEEGFTELEYERSLGQVVEVARAAMGGIAPWPERVRTGLGALLARVAAAPEKSLLVMRDLPASGPAAYRRHCEMQEALAALLHEGREEAEAGVELPERVELLAICAVESLIIGELSAGRGRELESMAPEILFSALAPFMGADRAAEEMRETAAAR